MVGEKKKKNKDPHRMCSILSALLRMKFTIRRWVTGRDSTHFRNKTAQAQAKNTQREKEQFALVGR